MCGHSIGFRSCTHTANCINLVSYFCVNEKSNGLMMRNRNLNVRYLQEFVYGKGSGKH